MRRSDPRRPLALAASLVALVPAALVGALDAGCSTPGPVDPVPAPSSVEPPSPSAAPHTSEPRAMKPYPPSPKGNIVDDYHGEKVPDPYRWLEDPDAPETVAWVQAQNRVTFDWLARVPSRDALRERIRTLWDYERYGPPSVEGRGKDRRTFFFKNDGLQNQSVLLVLEPGKTDPKDARVLLDPNALAEDGTVALAGYALSDDGKSMAYALSTGGSDWMEWHIRDVATGKDLGDVVKWSKFSGASFTKDGKGFFYARYPEPEPGAALEAVNYHHKLYYHRLGEPQEKDTLIFEDKENKERGFSASVSEDGELLVIHVWEGTDRRNRLYVKKLARADAPVLKVFDDFDAMYRFVGNAGTRLFILTDKDAPRGQLVAVDIAAASPKLEVVIPQHDTDKLEEVTMLGGGFLATWLQDAHDVVSFHDRGGRRVRDIALPTIGSVSGFSGKSTDKVTYYAFTSFTYPTVIYKLDLETGRSTEWQRPAVKFDPTAYETKQVRYRSKDGTIVPMFVVHKKGLAWDGDNPTYLYGYGGFNISLTPTFSVPLVAWLERGGVYAQPSLRGGGEYGQEWHRAGMLEKKQTVFDDFAAAAEWLIANKVTQPQRLAIGGGSNGGLLVGATITQRPDLVGAAVAMVGVMDMLRFHKFTIGHAWVAEYGSADDPKMYPVLKKYSPLHNLKPGTRYPATLITTADHDDRVVPAHSFKYAAAMQEAQGGDAPVLIRVDVKAGHGAGKPTTKVIEETADRWAFLLAALGVEPLAPAPTASTAQR